VLVEPGIRRPAHERRTDAIVFMQGHDGETGHQPGMPIGAAGVDVHPGCVAGSELPEFDEEGTALAFRWVICSGKGFSVIMRFAFNRRLTQDGSSTRFHEASGLNSLIGAAPLPRSFW
jgi:hypothetical protein